MTVRSFPVDWILRQRRFGAAEVAEELRHKKPSFGLSTSSSPGSRTKRNQRRVLSAGNAQAVADERSADAWRKSAFEALTTSGWPREQALLVLLALAPFDDAEPPQSDEFKQQALQLSQSFHTRSPESLQPAQAASEAAAVLRQIRQLAVTYREPYYTTRYDSFLASASETDEPDPFQATPPPAANPFSAASAAIESAPIGAYPVAVTFQKGRRRSRLLTFFSWLLLIPQFVVLYIFGIAVGLATIAAWFVVLFTGRLPQGMHSFFSYYYRWAFRAGAFLLLQAAPYPPFGDGSYPTDVHFSWQAEQSRLKTFFRWPIGIFFFAPAFVAGLPLLMLVYPISWIAVLLTGQIPSWSVRPMRWYLRYGQESHAFYSLMTDRTPRMSERRANSGLTYVICSVCTVVVILFYVALGSIGGSAQSSSSRSAFVTSCSAAETATFCGCAYDYITKQISVTQLSQYGEEIKRTGSIPPAYITLSTAAAKACQASS